MDYHTYKLSHKMAMNQPEECSIMHFTSMYSIFTPKDT